MATASSLPGTIQSAAKSILTNNSLSSSMALSASFENAIPIVIEKINRLRVNIKSFRVPLELSIREVIIPSIQTNFNDSGRPGWAPLADATEKTREMLNFYPGPALIRTGKLQRVATQLNIWEITSWDARMPSLPDKVFYGNIQQEGFGNGASKSELTKHVMAPIRKAGVVAPKRKAYWEAGFIAQTVAASKSAGGEHKGDYIPARPFMMIQPEDVAAIEKIFADWLGMRVMAAFR